MISLEREVKILDKTEEVMKMLKPLAYRERKMVLKFLEELIDVDRWLDNKENKPS